MISIKRCAVLLLITSFAAFLPWLSTAVPNNGIYYLSESDLKTNIRLAHKGDAEAAFRLYQYYGNWDRHGADSSQQVDYYLRLAGTLGYPAAVFSLGMSYEGDETYDEALYWYKKSLKLGNTDARIQIKMLNRKINPNSYQLTETKLQELMQKAKEGDAKSAYKVAEYYGFGPKNYMPGFEKKEIEYLTLAADLGNTEAMYALGYYDEALFEKYDKALYWYQKAAKQGYEKARVRIEKVKEKL